MNYFKKDNHYLELYREAVVIDGACPLANIDDYFRKWIDGGVTVIAPTVAADDNNHSAIQKIAIWLKKIEKNSDKLALITSVEDIYETKKQNKLGIIFHFQDTLPMGSEIELLYIYHRLGVRVIQLCYNVKNFVGDGCDERTDCGLSNFGVKVIREMNRLGILVDLSHTGYRTSMEAIEISKKPVVFSHSNVEALCPSRRNLSDDQIKAVAKRGGVIGLNGFPVFVAKRARPSVDDLIDHVNYIARLVGVEHVAIGLDYWEGMAGVASDDEANQMYNKLISSGRWKKESYPPPPWWYPTDIESPLKFPNLAKALSKSGYSEKNIKLILGGNFIRVYKEVW